MSNLYHLFAGEDYYPSGGAKDYISSENDLSKLVEYKPGFVDLNDWAHITDEFMTIEYVWFERNWTAFKDLPEEMKRFYFNKE